MTEPPRPHLVVTPDPVALAQAGARLWVDSARSTLAARDVFHVALAGGTTPATLHRAVAEQADLDYPWHRTHAWFGDERAVPPSDRRSNYRMAVETLFDGVPLSEAQVHRMRGEEPDLDAAAAAYERELRTTVGEGDGGVPVLDLVWLGLGTDGHTASLFPGSPALAVSDRAVSAVDGGPAESPRRLTLTLPVLSAARRVIFVVSGAAKAEAVAAVLEPPAGAMEGDLPPAARVQPGPGRLLWLVDEAAAARLVRTPRAHAAGFGPGA
ncbi:MAG: 6-phosphogluconolactonase [Candidatus Eisenbacteria bacterium]